MKKECRKKNDEKNIGRMMQLYFLCAFLAPLLFVLPVFAGLGLAPFGNRSLLAIDAWGQYFPMLKNMKRAIASGSVWYSFQGGLGFNLWAQSAYYTNSPFWVLIYLLPDSWMIAGVDLLVLVKFGLCGLSFARFWAEVRGDETAEGIVFGLAYSLCAYNLAFINQLMWADVVVFFPLVAAGILRMNRGGSGFCYLISLFLSIFSCFYIGYIACVGAVGFFGLLELAKKRSGREHGKHILRFAWYSLLAGGLAAVSLVPVRLALGQTISAGLSFNGEWKWYHPASELLARLLPFGKEALAYEAPNLYTGLLTVCLALFALTRKELPGRLRAGLGLAAAFLLVSFNLNGLDYFWHGFHYPNQLPGRQSFLFSFLLAGAGALGFSVWRKGKAKKWVRLALFLIALEVGANGVFMLASQTLMTDAVSYQAWDEEMEEAIRRRSSGETAFWRMERLPRWNFNPGQLYGYPGVTFYSSFMTAKAYRFFQNMGLPIYAKNVSTLYEPTPILNMMFGIRYLMDTTGENQTEPLMPAGQAGDLKIWENLWALPLAFRVEDRILDYMPAASAGGIESQNRWLIATGAAKENGLKALPVKEGQAFAWECKREVLEEAYEKLAEEGCTISSFTDTKIEGKIFCKEDGILHTTLPNDGGWQIYIDGEKAEVLELAGYLCGARILEGEHDLRFVYELPGLRAGATLSVVSFLGAAGSLWWERKKNL